MLDLFSVAAVEEAHWRRRQMLRTAFGPTIATALADPMVIEVMVNPDGKLWIERATVGRQDTGERIGSADAERIIRLVAAHVRREVHDNAPIVSAELPESGERFEGVMPPVAPAPCFAVRKPADARRSPVLEQIAPEELIELNPQDAKTLEVSDGDYIKVSTRRGAVVAKAWVTVRVPPGVVFGTFHYWEADANEETSADDLDPISLIPEFKISAAKVTKSSVAEAQSSVMSKRGYYREDVEVAAIAEMRVHQEGRP